jgi:hypothetical protein
MSDAALITRMRALEARLERIEKPDQGGVPVSYTPTYEGDSTPGVTTYSLQEGTYIRIGNIVVVSGVVVWTGATGTGDARISLPIEGASGLNQSGSLRLVGVTFAAGTPQIEFSGTPYFKMRSPATNAGGTLVQVEAAGNIIFTVVYVVD